MTQFLNNNLILIIAGLAVIDIVLIFLFLRTRKKIKIFVKGAKVMDIEEVVMEQNKIIKEVKNDIKKLYDHDKELQRICDISITKVGVVRFNPFKDVGGDQSFAIALLDSNDDGIVISSLYTREGTRVYTKPIEMGKSTYNLSDEEQEAIKKAIK